MSRRNNVRGPTSALTEFLKESGITPTTIARRVRTREVDQPVAGPSTLPDDQQDEEPERTRDADDYSSDNLDDTDTEARPKKKVKLSKAAEAKLKAKEKAKAKSKKKKSGDDDADYSDSGSDDPYTALAGMWKDTSKPPVGSFIDCAKCGNQFTVTKYTVAASGGGFLCHPCAKASGPDPFKKPAAPRKRRAVTDKRTVVNFEERRFPSLASMCVSIISLHIDDVEALGDIGSLNMTEIAKAIARDRSLTPQNATLFYNVENSTLTLYDATNLTPPALCTLSSLNPNLTTLRLDFCGLINDEVIDAWTTALPNLRRLELLGPFLVHSNAWQKFFAAHSLLEGFLITQSPRFDVESVRSLAEHCQNMSELRLKEIGQMSDDFLTFIGQLRGQLTYLDLSYPGVPDALTEEAVITLMEAVCSNLEHLDLSGNTQLTDGFLYHGLKPYARRLSTLVMSNVHELTDAGVAEFFDTWNTAVDPPNPPLVSIDFSRDQELSGKALASLLAHSGKALEQLNINGWRATPEKVLITIGRNAPLLKKLDIGWCRETDDWVIKDVVENCEKIGEIKVFGCQRLTERCPRKRNVNLLGVETHTI
ncbi:hypothetical protein NM688_g3267 [Phlebia brevispora]|uniref:Uncharacterized protein n=1 Tax=Phlebia brevispora TaxID=194682 RepID=A0ACC1T5Z0_9APHY|nr:hypothetical protein NM688_g3267 [Phlebia brevispora]